MKSKINPEAKKTCRQCESSLEASEFYYQRRVCKKCCNKKSIEWQKSEKGRTYHRKYSLAYINTVRGKESRLRHRQTEKYKETAKRYSKSEKEIARKNSEHYKEVVRVRRSKEKYQAYLNSPEYKEYQRNFRREYQKMRRETDPVFKIAFLLRRRVAEVVKGRQKSGSAVKDLGCSVEDLRRYLESKFKPGMSWENHGRYGWHIDHKKPLSKFDLTDREQFLEACHYTNLQPLWARENLIKGNKIL